MATIPNQLTRRASPGMVAPDYVQDPEARRVFQSQQWFQQWVIDNWPQPVEQVVAAPDIVAAVIAAIPQPPQPTQSSGGGGRGSTASDHSFKFTQTGTTGGTITAGTCQIDGTLKTITSLPSTLSSVTTSIKYWVSVDCLAKTATWASGAAYATGTKTVYIYPMLEITCAGSIITGFIQRRSTDIVATSSIGVHDPTSKDTIGSTSEGSETAEGTTKTFGSDDKGLTLYMTSRIGYYDAGAKTLWGYIRELRFDEGGRLCFVGGETRVSIDVLVAET